MSKRDGEWRSWLLVAFVLALPLAYAVAFAVFVAIDPDSAAVRIGLMTAATWLLALAIHLVRALPESVNARSVGLGFVGLMTSLAVSALAQLDVLDTVSGVAVEVAVGGFGIAALYFALLRPV